MRFGVTFGEVAPGELVAYTDSAGFVSIAVNGGSAAQRLRAASRDARDAYRRVIISAS